MRIAFISGVFFPRAGGAQVGREGGEETEGQYQEGAHRGLEVPGQRNRKISQRS